MGRLSRQRGFATGDVLLGIGLLALISVVALTQLASRQEDERAEVAAVQLSFVRAACDGYIRANFSALFAATNAGPVAISVPTLIAAQYLPPGTVATNVLQQTMYCGIEKLANGYLRSVVSTTGGVAMNDRRTAIAAQKLGDGAQVVAATPNTALILSGSTADLTALAGAGLAPAAGYFAAFDLYNPAVLGGTGWEFEGMGIYGNGDLIPKPLCAGSKVPRGFGATSNIATDAGGQIFTAVQTDLDDLGANWRVFMRIRDSTGWLTPVIDYLNAVVVVGCSPF